MTNPTALVSKLWNYCSILRDDGLSYGDYVEQLTPEDGGRAVTAARHAERDPEGQGLALPTRQGWR